MKTKANCCLLHAHGAMLGLGQIGVYYSMLQFLQLLRACMLPTHLVLSLVATVGEKSHGTLQTAAGKCTFRANICNL